MKLTVYCILSFFFLFQTNLHSQDLPNYMTEEEKQNYKDYPPPVIINPDDLNAPVSPVRTMAEWEELQAIMITWTSYPQILAQIVDYAQDECLVYIVCSDSNTVKTSLTSYGVPLLNLRFVITSFNSIWCRDYGPWCVYTNNIDTMRIIDWKYNRPSRPQDDLIPVAIANRLTVPYHQTISPPNDLTATGGNFMCDGNNTAFSSKLILTENSSHTVAEIDTIVKRYMGINRYVKMDVMPNDIIHHIDMHMKLLDEETIMVGQYPLGVSDGPQIETNLQYFLNNFQTCYGKQYKVVRIPMPPSSSGQYPPNSDYFTYTNSLIVNKTVIVPTYGFALDTTALRIYRDAMPGYRVVGILCNSIIPSSGAIHCITKEIGIYDPVFISHSGIRNTNNTSTPYEVKAYIKSISGISNAKCFWTTDTTAGFTQLNMTAIADTFRTNIPNQPLGTKIYYYIKATSNSGRIVSKPLTAPSGVFKFTITGSTDITELNNIPLNYELQQNYPNPFNPATVIKYSIKEDSYVILKVFDVLGRIVAVLVNQNQKAGIYSSFFDASEFPSGIYFYRLNAGNFSATKKMIVKK